MRFVPEIVYDQHRTYDNYLLRYYIKLENKTDRILYVDLANCFKIKKDNSVESYYKAEQTSVSHGGSSGGAVGLGGIANVLGVGGIAGTLANSVIIGGSSENSTMTSYSQNRILSIPPHATANLTEFKQVHIGKNNWKTISDLEYWSFPLERGAVKKYTHLSYNEETSPYTRKYVITYSESPDFSSYSMLYAKLYARYVVGCHWSFDSKGNSTKKIEKHIQKFISNYRNGSDILIGSTEYSY